MKKSLYLLVLVLSISFSCQEKAEEPTFEACGVNDPVTELTWLAEKTASYESSDTSPYIINIAEYNEETIFLMSICCTNCNTAITAYNCEGILLGIVGQNSEVDPGAILNERNFWTPRNFKCLEF